MTRLALRYLHREEEEEEEKEEERETRCMEVAEKMRRLAETGDGKRSVLRRDRQRPNTKHWEETRKETRATGDEGGSEASMGATRGRGRQSVERHTEEE
ncbi:hypothetical protein E2C01_039585 [Portunus trituberculatus]|uniref:Uncharacterized protein n=1 Tax=Portunus trituberculatus TaxID=210409 RepID=A0A5B7FL51_PORTR|nr:hypothetical protein [Portunus trituberculatus]